MTKRGNKWPPSNGQPHFPSTATARAPPVPLKALDLDIRFFGRTGQPETYRCGVSSIDTSSSRPPSNVIPWHPDTDQDDCTKLDHGRATAEQLKDAALNHLTAFFPSFQQPEGRQQFDQHQSTDEVVRPFHRLINTVSIDGHAQEWVPDLGPGSLAFLNRHERSVTNFASSLLEQKRQILYPDMPELPEGHMVNIPLSREEAQAVLHVFETIKYQSTLQLATEYKAALEAHLSGLSNEDIDILDRWKSIEASAPTMNAMRKKWDVAALEPPQDVDNPSVGALWHDLADTLLDIKEMSLETYHSIADKVRSSLTRYDPMLMDAAYSRTKEEDRSYIREARKIRDYERSEFEGRMNAAAAERKRRKLQQKKRDNRRRKAKNRVHRDEGSVSGSMPDVSVMNEIEDAEGDRGADCVSPSSDISDNGETAPSEVTSIVYTPPSTPQSQAASSYAEMTPLSSIFTETILDDQTEHGTDASADWPGFDIIRPASAVGTHDQLSARTLRNPFSPSIQSRDRARMLRRTASVSNFDPW